MANLDFFRLITCTCGVGVLIMMLTNKDLFYYHGLFVVVVCVGLWGEYDWYTKKMGKKK